MSEKLVIVHRTSDPIQADMLGELLRANRIAARVLGTRHGAAIGVSQHILELHIEVPQSQAGEATDFLEAFFEGDGAALLAEHVGLEDAQDDGAGAGLDNAQHHQAGAGPDRAGDGTAGDAARDAAGDAAAQATGAAASPVRAPGTQPLRAALAVLLLFGGGHFYARRPGTALVLAAGQAAALLGLLAACAAPAVNALVMGGALVIFDLAGGQAAARALGRGVRVSLARQLAVGAALVAAAGLLGALFAPAHAAGASHASPRVPAVQPAF